MTGVLSDFSCSCRDNGRPALARLPGRRAILTRRLPQPRACGALERCRLWQHGITTRNSVKEASLCVNQNSPPPSLTRPI
jgi:hypothetical protein